MVKEEIMRNVRKYFDIKENEDSKTFWVQIVSLRKFVVINACFFFFLRFQIN